MDSARWVEEKEEENQETHLVSHRAMTTAEGMALRRKAEAWETFKEMQVSFAALLGVESQGRSQDSLKVLAWSSRWGAKFPTNTGISSTQVWCGGRKQRHAQIFSYLKDVLICAFLYAGILPLIIAPDKERMELLQTWWPSSDIPAILGAIRLAMGIP